MTTCRVALEFAPFPHCRPAFLERKEKETMKISVTLNKIVIKDGVQIVLTTSRVSPDAIVELSGMQGEIIDVMFMRPQQSVNATISTGIWEHDKQ